MFEPYSPCLNSFIWYWMLHYNRTDEEKALNPRKIKTVFERAGFTGFHWHKIRKVKHIYYRESDTCIYRGIGILRKFANEKIIPNVFFTGVAWKK